MVNRFNPLQKNTDEKIFDSNRAGYLVRVALAKAEDVKAALLVEKELERLNGEIEFREE